MQYPIKACYKNSRHSPIAQLVEHVTVNHRVGGSSPSRGAIYPPLYGVAKVNFSYMLGGIIINVAGYALYAMGAALLWSLWRKTFPHKTFFALWALLMVIYSSPLPVSLIHHLENESRVMAPEGLVDDFDGFILLGGCFSLADTKMDDKRPVYNAAGSRLFDFILLAKEWSAKRIVLTGTAVEVEQMKQELIRFGVDEDRIIGESKSRNTEDNATKTFELVQPQGKWVLVTSAFHMKRSALLFEKAGWSVTPWPVGFLTGKTAKVSWWPYPGNGWAWYASVKELLALWRLGEIGSLS